MNVDQYIPDWAKEPRPAADDAPPVPGSWREALSAALFAGVIVGTAVLLANQPMPVKVAEPALDGDDESDDLAPADEEVEAAARLGVDVDASADVVRAALRDRLCVSRIHPDHGGNHDEAARMIAAKNLLCARARRRDRNAQ